MKLLKGNLCKGRYVFYNRELLWTKLKIEVHEKRENKLKFQNSNKSNIRNTFSIKLKTIRTNLFSCVFLYHYFHSSFTHNFNENARFPSSYSREYNA